MTNTLEYTSVVMLWKIIQQRKEVLFCWSVAKLCLTLCNLTDRSMPDLPVLPYLPEFARIYVHWVSDAS